MNTSHKNTRRVPTKEKIINAAIRCFARMGIEQTKLIDIAEAAKIKHNLILYHFQDFEELCMACVEKVVHNFFQETQEISLEKQKNTLHHLQEFINAHFQLAKQHPAAFSLWLHFYYKTSHNDHYKQLLKTLTFSSLEKLKSIIMQHAHEKNLEMSDLQIELSAKMIIGQIIGQLILSLAEENPNFDHEANVCFHMAKEFLK